MFDKILFVDDDPITLMLCKKVIEKAEFSKEIVSAHNGEDALRYFDELKLKIEEDQSQTLPQLMFLDLNMPVMGGWEFLDLFSDEKYQSFFSNLKVIVLSSTIDPKDIEKSKSYNMVIHFLSKPITKEMLTSIKNI